MLPPVLLVALNAANRDAWQSKTEGETIHESEVVAISLAGAGSALV